MLFIFKPSGATKACADLAVKIEGLLQDNPEAIVLKVKTDISDASIPFIHPLANVEKGAAIVIAGHGCAYTLLANLFSLWDRGIVFKIKKLYFGLSSYKTEVMEQVIERHFGRSIWED